MSASPNPIDMTTLDFLQQEWIPGEVSGEDSDVLQRIITGVSRDVVRYTGSGIDNDPESPTYGASSLNSQINFTQRLDGNGSNVLFLRNRPIIAINSLMVNGYAPPINVAYGQLGVFIESTGYSVAFGEAFGSGGSTITVGFPSYGPSNRFPMGRGNVLISYLAGFGVPTLSPPDGFTTPEDLEVAVCQICQLVYARRDRSGLDSENIQGSAATTYTKTAWPVAAQEVINRYVRVPLGAQA